MADKVIQEQFGEQVIELFASFARADLRSPAQLEALEFSHITDEPLRQTLAQVFYGVRWIYKLGLALLTENEERAAHIRTQIVDYASVCEGLLSHCIVHAIRTGATEGTAYHWFDPDLQTKKIHWNQAHPENAIGRQSFWWIIRMAGEFTVIRPPLEDDLQWLRKQRNTVHLRQRASLGRTAYLNQSKKAFEITTRTIQATKSWKAAHP